MLSYMSSALVLLKIDLNLLLVMFGLITWFLLLSEVTENLVFKNLKVGAPYTYHLCFCLE